MLYILLEDATSDLSALRNLFLGNAVFIALNIRGQIKDLDMDDNHMTISTAERMKSVGGDAKMNNFMVHAILRLIYAVCFPINHVLLHCCIWSLPGRQVFSVIVTILNQGKLLRYRKVHHSSFRLK